MLNGGIRDAVEDVARIAQDLGRISSSPRNAGLDWKAVDGALRSIRRRRAGLDAEEARWLREAERLEIWRPLGMVSLLDYLERVLGYPPRTAQDRLRVARALGDLSQLTAALTEGALPFSAVRELTRVATPMTEASWIAAATGKNLRQIEELVADHRPGDRPEDPPAPEARTHVVRFELSAETFALLRQARTAIDDDHGTNLPDDAFIAALCGAVLDGAPQGEPSGRAKFQIAVTVCERCRQGWQEGGGARIAIGASAVDRALCDAQHIGSIDGDGPERAHQDVPPSVARFVWRRDGGRCRVDGCRSSRGLELHHLIHRADGGTHDASNIVLTCSACHQAHHRGVLTISGTSEELHVRRPGGTVASSGQEKLVGSGKTPARNPHGGATSQVACSALAADPAAHVGATSSAVLAADRAIAVDDAGAGATRSAALAVDRALAGDDVRRREMSSVALAADRTQAADLAAHVGATRSAALAMDRSLAVDDAGAGATRSAALATDRAQGVADPAAHVGAMGSAVLAADRALAADDARADAMSSAADRALAADDAHVGGMISARPVGDPRAAATGSCKLDAAILRAQAKAALTGLGWKPAIARAAVADAADAHGDGLTLERLIFEALRRCPTPRA